MPERIAEHRRRHRRRLRGDRHRPASAARPPSIPGLLGPDDYDVAGAAVGAVEADALLGADRVRDGDVVLALASSGLHATASRWCGTSSPSAGIGYTDRVAELGGVVGEALLEPTRLYTAPLLRLLGRPRGSPCTRSAT